MLFRLYITHITFNNDFSSYKDWVFRSVVAIVFQNAFHSEMHQINVFSFFLNSFLHQHIKTI
jgi:hypothetical protein